MRICFLASAQSIHTQRWAKFFVERGHEIHIISRELQELNYASVYAPKLPSWLTRQKTIIPHLLAQGLNAFKVRSLVRKITPDILVAFTFQSYGVLAMMSGFHPVVSFHLGASGISVWPEVSLIIRILVRGILRTSDLLHTFDQAGRKRLIELGCEDSKIYVNPWGIDTNDFVPKLRSEDLRREMGNGQGPVVVCARSLEKQYDVDTYIRAMPEIQQKIPDVRFVLIGSGSQRKRLCELAVQLKVRNFKHIDYCPYDKFSNYLANCDVYVDAVNMPLPKGRTWFGHKKNCSMAGLGYTQTLLAAMSCQLGWTVTRRPGVEELVPDGFERFLFSPSNEKELAKNVIELLNNEQMRKEFGVLSRQKVCQIADWKTNALKMEDSLRQLVDRQGYS